MSILILLILGFSLFAEKVSEGIFAYKVGQFEVFVLVEAEREGNVAILIDVDEEILKNHIPETGFKHSTNAFLIKTSEQNILIDAGTGAGRSILEKIELLGLEKEEIDTILLTHLHFDHFGGLRTENDRNFPNAKIYLSKEELLQFTEVNPNQAAIETIELYSDNVVTFDANMLDEPHNELMPGIIPIANFGHTPGHTVFLVENNGEKLIIAGDFLHVPLVQFSNPDISATFDVDPVMAAFSRKQIIDYAAKNKIPIGGMHIVLPGIGNVISENELFNFIPLDF